jgi:hypothetical protein
MRKLHIAPNNYQGALKFVNREIASLSSKEIRQRSIDTAYMIRDRTANNAPTATYARIIKGLPLERHYNYNSGFDFDLKANASYGFTLKVSTDNFSKGVYQNYNPIYGLLNSNYGRRKLYSKPRHKFPIAVDRINQRGEKYNHPTMGHGYRGMYSRKEVLFVDTINPIIGTHWIERAVDSSKTKAKNILAGKTSYSKRTQKSLYWG